MYHSKGITEERRTPASTVFVSNIPDRFHWKGLWLLFGKYGEVADSFISSKRNRSGAKFGFVRFWNREDALKVIKNLNGSILLGKRLVVLMAKYKTRDQFWRRDKMQKEQERNNQRNPNAMYEGGDGVDNLEGFQDNQKNMKKRLKRNPRLKTSTNGDSAAEGIRRIVGHIESDELMNLKRCLIGQTA
ncbi:hypothetical protein F3Y22_tig00005377pilonHSYRG00260 [Hibiscus syriacus]|uniref:RRM domain-containing protein n=1 Tax=Hibiscus syriacus TaxID=106335 RepID=A0A6A3CL02_HIBSY|nr:polyadenylate-binding protein 5-like [Hibiscus syriacus]KAE8727779.1 hypothetical protein F3Y22_tig00005377pilonHSYRG00260 [Hibiscus syriacus]